jgi:hypothetical protein
MASLNSYHCAGCKERWFTREKFCDAPDYLCSSCRGKDETKYTAFNDMDPQFELLTDQNREDLSKCTQIEEMLLSPVIPIFTVYRKENGRVATSGFVANFQQDNVTVVNQIPRTIASLPLMFVKRGDQVIDETSK